METGVCVGFAGMAWKRVGVGAREKRATRSAGGREVVVRLVEFSPPFEEEGWCEAGHTGLVVSGGFVLETEHGRTVFEAGDGVVIPAGQKHRAVVDRAVVLFLVEGGEVRGRFGWGHGREGRGARFTGRSSEVVGGKH